jgi:hypothetical protein
MLQRLRDRLTYANVMSTVAVFVALGGVSYAVSTLPANSVGTKQLRKHSVTSVKLSPRTVAPNARRLRGHAASFYVLHCRRGTLHILDGCYEPNERSANNYFGANESCLDVGGRLPTVGELQELHDHMTIPGPEISYDVTFINGTQEYLTAPGAGGNHGYAAAPLTTTMPYRCYFAPSN